MPDLVFDPPAAPPKSLEPFLQTVRLLDADAPIGQAHWHSGADPTEGVAQLLDLSILPAYRRKGHGVRLMDAATAQATAFYKARKSRLRRMWAALHQKHHVVGRSFLMKFGFHHVGTVNHLLKDEDLLIYMRTFD